jgi:uncharacterized protein (TIGR02646 family)
MIRIRKSPDTPEVLLTRGLSATKALCDAFDASPADYRRGVKTFSDRDFERSIYASGPVKVALREAQHDKCAFCESRVSHVSHGDVEHFRPKSGFKQREADLLRRPGYYWLAYEWTNLFFCCQLCNQQFKKNLFPLKDGRRRARSHRHRLDREEPLLVDPSSQEPAQYLGFHEHIAHPVGGCREGRTTIDVLGLNREKLAGKREERLKSLRLVVASCIRLRAAVANSPEPEKVELMADLETHLREAATDPCEYAAMVRAYLATHMPDLLRQSTV